MAKVEPHTWILGRHSSTPKRKLLQSRRLSRARTTGIKPLEKWAMHAFIPECAFVDLQNHLVCKQWCHWVRNIMQPHDRKQVWWGGLFVLFQGEVRRLLSPEASFGPFPLFQWCIKLLWNLLISYLASWGWFGFLMGGGGHGLTSYPWTLKTLGKSQTVSGFVSSSLIASAGVCTLLPNACATREHLIWSHLSP